MHAWVQTPAPHFSEPTQALQAAPPLPHLLKVLPATQVLPLQQPVGHEVALQLQVLSVPQVWPVPQT